MSPPLRPGIKNRFFSLCHIRPRRERGRSKCFFHKHNIIRPLLEFDSHIRASAEATFLAFFNRIQKWEVRLINDQPISSSIDSLQHRRNVSGITLFNR